MYEDCRMLFERKKSHVLGGENYAFGAQKHSFRAAKGMPWVCESGGFTAEKRMDYAGFQTFFVAHFHSFYLNVLYERMLRLHTDNGIIYVRMILISE